MLLFINYVIITGINSLGIFFTMHLDLQTEIQNTLQETNTNQELQDAVAHFCRELGVDHFSFVSSLFNFSSTTPDLHALSNYPVAWQKRYQKANYVDVDLTIQHARTKSSPLIWLNEDIKLDPINRRLFDEASDYGIRSGITYPFHGVGSEFGSFSATVADRFRHSALDSVITQHSLYLLGAALFDLYQQRKGSTLTKKLTQREKECLRWAAEGKTSWEMSVILNISERTACFHLDNARKKLNSLTRTGAVTKALLHSLL